MNAVFGLSWRAYPIGVLLVLGGAMVVLGLRRMWQPFRSPIDTLAWMTGFRLGIVAGRTHLIVGICRPRCPDPTLRRR